MSIRKEAGDLLVIVIKVLVRAIIVVWLLGLINIHVEFWVAFVVGLCTL